MSSHLRLGQEAILSQKAILSYWKPVKKVATHDPLTKNETNYDPEMVEVEYLCVTGSFEPQFKTTGIYEKPTD